MADDYEIGVGAQGFIADQTLLLQVIRDGLAVYNREGSAQELISRWCEDTIRQTTRVSQAPLRFRRSAEGATSENQKVTYRMLYAPFLGYDLSVEYTDEGLQDALESDIIADMNGAMIGDNELVLKLMFQAMLVPHASASVVGTPMTVRNGFYNGETDVPRFGSNAFGSAHYHYAGLNTTTLALSHITSMIKDVQEHGYGRNPNSLALYFNSQEGKAITDLAAFTATAGVASPERDRLASLGAGAFVGTLAGTRLIQNDWIPAGYLLLLDEADRPLQRRVHPVGAYNGLQIYAPHEANSGAPLLGSYFKRRVGFTVGQMGAGTARQLVASTSYTAPTTSFDFS